MTINITQTFQGAWKLSTIKNGYLFTKQYSGYTKSQALKLFKQEVKR